ncbi:hypothetical protein PR048_019028 [Dryococelus australis]|uniref:Uncharacterized protein n=1 Tax=Dryococelus australis TaxID=614101 RepID=A0ABQ9H2E9_9NEOP|nr:hypothetical protein PR048_019028 [Dryococelus australis]
MSFCPGVGVEKLGSAVVSVSASCLFGGARPCPRSVQHVGGGGRDSVPAGLQNGGSSCLRTWVGRTAELLCSLLSGWLLLTDICRQGGHVQQNALLPNAPVFISFFLALRGMTNVPVESMRMGGLFWFTDLTLPDQYFILPIITSITMYLTIELGTDGARLSSSNLQTMRYVLRALPICILPFTINFPGCYSYNSSNLLCYQVKLAWEKYCFIINFVLQAILCYWTSTNFISLIQVLFLKIPMVREHFKIDPLVHHKPETLPVKPKGFVEGVKDCNGCNKLAGLSTVEYAPPFQVLPDLWRPCSLRASP